MATTLNRRYSALTTRRRYEVWFVRLGLAGSNGAWWFRYLLMNPGRLGCPKDPRGMPVQIWATWFPPGEKPQSFIQGYPLEKLELSDKADESFYWRVGENEIRDDSCCGSMEVDGHRVSWNLRYSSSLSVTMSNKGWIGFSRTPHFDARFSGRIELDGRSFEGDTLGFGVQGHNCGYRHRGFWRWAHAYFPDAGNPSAIEVLVYDMPFGLIFRRAILWHKATRYVFRNVQETEIIRTSGQLSSHKLEWSLRCSTKDGLSLDVDFDGGGPSAHRLPYLKTDCSGTFDVVNNSLAKARLRLTPRKGQVEELITGTGAVLEMAGEPT